MDEIILKPMTGVLINEKREGQGQRDGNDGHVEMEAGAAASQETPGAARRAKGRKGSP